jgi:hypothetical protein
LIGGGGERRIRMEEVEVRMKEKRWRGDSEEMMNE